MKLPRYSPEQEFYRDADGYDLAQDTRWDETAGGDFHPDPSFDDWSRPRRSLLKSPVRREDFDPTGLPPLGVVPAPTDCRGIPSDTPALIPGRRVHPPFAA